MLLQANQLLLGERIVFKGVVYQIVTISPEFDGFYLRFLLRSQINDKYFEGRFKFNRLLKLF